MRALWLASALAVGCRAPLPDPAEPLARTPDAAFRQRAPDRLPGTPPARLPPVRAERLANGLLVVVAARPSSPTTSVELVVRGVEARSEGAGLALATVYALAEGPEAMFTANVEHEAAYLGIHTDDAGLADAVKELAGAVLRPRIDQTVLEGTRTYLSRRIQREGLDNLIHAVAYQRLYAEPPALLVAPGSGTYADTDYTITKEEVLRQYGRFYGPENAALIVAGPASFERAMSLAVEHFGRWKPGERPAPPSPAGLPLLVPSLGPRPVIALDWTGDMAHALLILPGPPRGFPGFPEYLLTNVLLGNSLGSRGNVALRLHDAKSYGVNSALERRRAGSELAVLFSVEPDDLVESLQRMLGEVERLRRELVSADELEIAKIAWQAQLSSRLVTCSGTVALLREEFALDGDPTLLGAIVESVEQVRPADIQAVARREFTTDRMQVVVFASRKTHEAALRHVGSIWWQELEL